jgi:hypothetical protein
MLSTIIKIPVNRWISRSIKLLIILLIIAINHPVSAQLLSPSKILLNFSEPMSRETIFDTDNYTVTANDNIPVRVIKVGIVEGDSSVVLFIDKDDDWSSFKIVVSNLKDKAGNLINAEKNVAEINTMLAKNTPVTMSDIK